MRFLGVVLASAAFLALGVRAEQEAVVTLTDSTFDEYIKSHDYVLAEFYAPWCGHCKKLTPEYEKAAQALKTSLPEVTLAKIDATAEKALASKYDISGFPTLKWFVRGEAKDYQGGRTSATIVQWISKKVGPSAKTLATPADLEAFKASTDVVMVGLFNDADSAKGFLAAASDAESIPYGIATGDAAAALKEAVGAASIPAIVLFKKFDEGKAVFEGDFSSAEVIGKFALGNSLPLVTEFTQETAPKIFGGAIKQHLLIFVDGASQKDAIVKTVSPVAKKNVGKLLFVTVDKSESRVVEYFGIKEYPAARIVEMNDGMKKYKLQAKEITEETISEFIRAHAAGELSQDLKSEDIPASQDGDVFVLVAKQFKEIVQADNHKNVLLEIYAPWCGHCKKLTPIYEELAKKYKHADNLIIAKMDGTANEVPDFQVGGFPTLKFFPAGSKEIVDYNGGREVADFSKFLEEKIPGLSSAKAA